MEAGLKSGFTKTDNNVLWEEMNKSGWQTDSTRTNHFIYHENILAAYLSGSKQIGKYNIRVGLRAEHTEARVI